MFTIHSSWLVMAGLSPSPSRVEVPLYVSRVARAFIEVSLRRKIVGFSIQMFGKLGRHQTTLVLDNGILRLKKKEKKTEAAPCGVFDMNSDPGVLWEGDPGWPQATMEREPNKRLGAHHTAQVKAGPSEAGGMKQNICFRCRFESAWLAIDIWTDWGDFMMAFRRGMMWNFRWHP